MAVPTPAAEVNNKKQIEKALFDSMDDNSNASSCSKDDQDDAVKSDQPIDWSNGPGCENFTNTGFDHQVNQSSSALFADQEPFRDIQKKTCPYTNPLLGLNPEAGFPGTDTTSSIELRDTTLTSNNGARGPPTLDTNNYKPPIRPSPEDNRPDPVTNGGQEQTRRKRVSVRMDTETKLPFVLKKYLGKPNEREIEVLEKLKHKSIPKLYNVDEHEKYTVLKMEYCGKPLSSYVKKFYGEGRLVPENFIWEILEQLFDVLKYLEAAKVMSRNITEETVCIQQDTRKGLVMKLVGFGKALTCQDLSAPDQATWDIDMIAGGRLAVFMVYGPWVSKLKDPKNENDFPEIYSYNLRKFILKMVNRNSSGMSPCTGLKEIYRICQHETIELSSESEEEQHETSSSLNLDYQRSSVGDGGHPEVIELLSDTDEGLPKSSSKVQLADQPTSAEKSLSSAVKLPQKQISYLTTAASADLPIITPPRQSSNPDSTIRNPGSGIDPLQGHGPIGTCSSRPPDVIAVNPGASWNGSRPSQTQASTVTLGKIKSHLIKNKVHQEKPYIRPQTDHEFNNLPDFEKIEGHPEVINLLSDTDRELPKFSSKVQLADQPTSAEKSLSSAVKLPQKQISFLTTAASADLPIITPPRQSSNPNSTIRNPGSGIDPLEGRGPIGTCSSRPPDVISVNPGASWNGSRPSQTQASAVTLGKIKSHLIKNKVHQEKPYIRPQTDHEFNNLPDFEKIEGTYKMKKKSVSTDSVEYGS